MIRTGKEDSQNGTHRTGGSQVPQSQVYERVYQKTVFLAPRKVFDLDGRWWDRSLMYRGVCTTVPSPKTNYKTAWLLSCNLLPRGSLCALLMTVPCSTLWDVQ